MSRSNGKTGFTLTELLVVLGILALLVVLGISVANVMRGQARTVACASHLRQWGVAIMGFAADNRGQIPPSVMAVSGAVSAPSLIRSDEVGTPAQFNVTTMNQYVDSANKQALVTSGGQRILGQGGFTGIWNCPGAAWTRSGMGFSSTSWAPSAYLFRFSYLYFGWSRAWTGIGSTSFFSDAAAQDLLSDRRMDSGRLLMADSCSFSAAGNWDNQLWFLNHLR